MSKQIRIPFEALIIQEQNRHKSEQRPALRIETPRYKPEMEPQNEVEESFIEINISGDEEPDSSDRGVTIISMI
jgi:hypothetical protein